MNNRRDAIIRNAFVRPPRSRRERDDGPLIDRSFAVKDNIDVRGEATSAGQPTWEAAHPSADVDAPIVRALLEAGATVHGKTVMDELAYGIEGINRHHGHPINPRAPERVCGGSSCGSASLAAAGEVDFALGTDTAGSIRVPSSWCGLYGIRPGHGLLSLDGIVPLSPPFDTVGWMASEVETFTEIGRVLLAPDSPAIAYSSEARYPAMRSRPPRRIRWWRAAFEALPSPWRERALSQVEDLQRFFACSEEIDFEATPEDRESEWSTALRLLQSRGIAETWRVWIDREQPSLAPWIAQRFQSAFAVDDGSLEDAEAIRQRCRDRLTEACDDAWIALPATAGPAPLRTANDAAQLHVRLQTMRLVAPACLSGQPQLVIPSPPGDGSLPPLGIALIAARGDERSLLEQLEVFTHRQ